LGLRTTLAVYYFAFFGTMGAYFPYLPPWLAEQGFSGVQISLITALMPVMSVLAPPLFGLLSDSFALRGALIRVAGFGAILACATLAAFSFSDLGSSFSLLFICIFAFTFFRAPMAQLSDVLALEQAGDYARLRVWGSIGFMVAAPLAGRYVPLSPTWMLPLSVGLGLVAVFAISFALPARGKLPETPTLTETRKLLRRGLFQWFLLVAALGQAAHAAYDLCISLHLRDLGASGTTIGFAWAIATAGEVVVMAISAWLLRRFSLAWWLLIALVTGALRWAFLAGASDVDLIVALQPVHGLTFGMRWVVSMMIVRSFASNSNLATAQGLYLAAMSAGGALGLVSWGKLYDLAGSRDVFSGACALATLAALSVLPLLRRQTRRQPATA
jgi:PPP family 3-phenylpropionic acid transporter